MLRITKTHHQSEASLMSSSIQAWVGFSKRGTDPTTGNEIIVPGYLDNPVVPALCDIHDARQAADASLDTYGFQIIRHETTYATVRDKEVLRVEYNDEM